METEEIINNLGSILLIGVFISIGIVIGFLIKAEPICENTCVTPRLKCPIQEECKECIGCKETIIYVESGVESKVDARIGELKLKEGIKELNNVTDLYLQKKYSTCREDIKRSEDSLLEAEGLFNKALINSKGGFEQYVNLSINSINYLNKWRNEYYRLCSLRSDSEFVPVDDLGKVKGFYGNYSIYSESAKLINKTN